MSLAEKDWLYTNLSSYHQMFADKFYYGLGRERIKATSGSLAYPLDMLKHNVFTEPYPRKMAPYWDDVHPTITQGIVKRARPGSEYSWGDGSNLGYIFKQREFGRIADPNLETTATDANNKVAILRQQYAMGSRQAQLYNYSDRLTGFGRMLRDNLVSSLEVFKWKQVIIRQVPLLSPSMEIWVQGIIA